MSEASEGPGQKPTIAFDDFLKLDLRAAKVLEVAEHPNADKLLVLKVDLGNEQRQIVAGLKPYYCPEALLGSQVVVLTNIEPRKMRGVESAGMLLAVLCDRGETRDVVVLKPDKEVPPGSSIS